MPKAGRNLCNYLQSLALFAYKTYIGLGIYESHEWSAGDNIPDCRYHQNVKKENTETN